MNENDKVWVDRFLDLRNYLETDITCWIHDDAQMALRDAINRLDAILKEATTK